MTFVKNRKDWKNLTILNQLVDKGGDVVYSDGLWRWNGLVFHSLKAMCKQANISVLCNRWNLESYQ